MQGGVEIWNLLSLRRVGRGYRFFGCWRVGGFFLEELNEVRKLKKKKIVNVVVF